MMQSRSLTFKIASEQSEFEQIHRLNYQAFVVEIPQHPPNAEQRLVDRFHAENTYVICSSGERVLGMVAIRESVPSPSITSLRAFNPTCRYIGRGESRLLAIDREHRNSRVFQGLLLKVCACCESGGYDLAVMSGTTRQLKLYQQLGLNRLARSSAPERRCFSRCI